MVDDILQDEHEEREKRRRKKTAITIGLFVFLVVGLLFFDTFYHLIVVGQVKRDSLLDKVSRQIAKISPQEEQALIGEAERLLAEGKIDAAREKILDLIRKKPSSEAMTMAGIAYLRQGNVKGAYDYLREAVRLNPKNLAAQEKLGEIFVLIGDYQAAQRQASLLAEGSDGKFSALLLEAEIALREGNPSLALKKAEEAFVMKGPTPKQRVFQASLYFRLGEKKKAAEIIAHLNPLEMDAEGLLSLGRYYQFIGEEKKANEVYAVSLAKFSSYPEVLYDYGLFLFGQRDYLKALEYLEKAHRNAPGAAIITYHLGQAAIAAGRMDRVKLLIEELFAQDPGSVLAWRLKGEFHMAQGDRRGAIEAYNKVTQLIPEAAYIYGLLAELYLKEGELTLAEKYARQAINMGEGSPMARLVMAELLYRQGNWAEAKRFYYEVLRLQPAHLIALLGAGDCELNQRNLKQAEDLYHRALTFYPQVRFIQARLGKLKLAMGDRAGALEISRRYYETHKKEPRAIIEYANTLILNGQYNEAERVLEEGMKVLPEDGFLPLAAGDLQLLKGEKDKALKVYNRAETAASQDPNLLINVAARYVAIQRMVDAERVYLLAYRKYPSDVHVLNEVAWFFIDTLGRPDRATEMVEVLKKRGAGANEKDTVGWYYLLKGQEKTAEYYLNEALKLDPHNPVIQGHRVLLLARLGREKEAREEALKIINRLPQGELKTRLLAISQAKSS